MVRADTEEDVWAGISRCWNLLLLAHKRAESV